MWDYEKSSVVTLINWQSIHKTTCMQKNFFKKKILIWEVLPAIVLNKATLQRKMCIVSYRR